MSINNVKRTIINFSLMIAMLIAFLFIIELLVRAIYKDSTVLFPRYHTDAQYGDYNIRKIRPDSTFWHTSVDGRWKFTTNNQGFRNDEDFGYHKPEGTIRVLSIGDSHTQGYEVRQDYTFSSIIEKYLKLRGYKTDVINAGVSGFSTAEALVFLENEGIKYAPDYVVLGFYANDYQDNIKSKLFKLNEDGTLSTQNKSHIPGVKIQNLIYSLPMVKWLSENSYFYSLLFNNVWKFFKTKLANSAADKPVEYAIPTQDEFSDYQTSLASALLQKMKAFCETNNIKLLILDIPQLEGKSSAKTSFSGSLLTDIESFSDAHVFSQTLLSDLSGTAEIHRPHGHKHISEITHTLLGIEAAKKIILLNQ